MRLPILILHISAGILGLLSGTAAMIFRKGSRGHRAAGNVFVISMLTMAVGTVYLAILKGQMANILGGILTFYMVGTAWATARAKAGQTSLINWIALPFALTVTASQITFGLQAVLSPSGLRFGYPPGIFFFMGSIALLASIGDVRLLIRGSISGTPRLARHLWRMCLGLFIASGSFFLGQQKVFPAFLRGSNALFVLAVLPLLLLVFWLIRVRVSQAYKSRPLPQTANAH
jgi:uncharacterized membrane protein